MRDGIQAHDNAPLAVDRKRGVVLEIIVTSSVDRFRRLADSLPDVRASVLEIGCSTGMTTRILAQRCARVVAVDVSREMMDKTCDDMAGFGNVTVARGDGRDLARLRCLLPNPDFIFLDIGGAALLGNVASLLRECIRAFDPLAIVVRSIELAEAWGLITEAEVPGSPRLRCRIVESGRAQALGSLMDLSRSCNASDRVFAARQLRKLGIPVAQQRLREMADDPNSKVRRISGSACRDFC